MDLLDRYLQAVRFWLPAKQEHDIIAELFEDLHSQIQEKEDALGCPLNEDEQVTREQSPLRKVIRLATGRL